MKKKKNTSRNWRTYTHVAVFLTLLIIAGIWIAMLELSKPNLMAYADEQHTIHEQTYREARELWDAQELTNYRLTIRFYHPGGSCTATFDIIDGNGELADALGDACDGDRYRPIEDWTINGIFNRFESIYEEKPCGPNGCDCDGYILPIVEYDEELGFPAEVRFWMTGNESYPDDDVVCTEIGMGAAGYTGDTFMIEQVEPLPDE